MIVPKRITRCTPTEALRDVSAAIWSALGRPPTQSEAYIYLAHIAFETSNFERFANNNPAGVKGGGAWKGDVAEHLTHEVENGVRVPKTLAFRAYPTILAGIGDWLANVILRGYPDAARAAGMGDPEAYVLGLRMGWGRGAHYFSEAPATYAAGLAQRIAWLHGLGLPLDEYTSRAPARGGAP